jgi:hypothetical protein
MTRILAVVALLLSLLSCGLAGGAFLQTRAAARAAIDEREAEMVDLLRPQVIRIYRDFDSVPDDVQTTKKLDVLLGPMFELVTAVGKEG